MCIPSTSCTTCRNLLPSYTGRIDTCCTHEVHGDSQEEQGDAHVVHGEAQVVQAGA